MRTNFLFSYIDLKQYYLGLKYWDFFQPRIKRDSNPPELVTSPIQTFWFSICPRLLYTNLFWGWAKFRSFRFGFESRSEVDVSQIRPWICSNSCSGSKNKSLSSRSLSGLAGRPKNWNRLIRSVMSLSFGGHELRPLARSCGKSVCKPSWFVLFSRALLEAFIFEHFKKPTGFNYLFS